MSDSCSKADGDAREQQNSQIRCEGGKQRRCGDSGNEAHHEAATFDNIAERNEGKDADGIADLRGDSDGAHAAVIHVEAASHVEQKGLIVVDVRDADTACQAEKGQQAVVFRVKINRYFRGNGFEVFQISN